MITHSGYLMFTQNHVGFGASQFQSSCREEVFLFNSFLTQNMEIVKTQFWIEERKEYMKDGFCPQTFTICPQYIVYTPITLY